MADAIRKFEKRARALESKHRKLANGYVTHMDRDGVMRHRPISRFRILRPRGILMLIVGFLVFKGFLLSQMGAEAYGLRLQSLAEGGMLNRAGAVILADDPITTLIAGMLDRVL